MYRELLEKRTKVTCLLWVRSRNSVRSRPCQLYRRKRTLGLSRAMSAKCQKADILRWGKNVVA